MSNTKNCLEAAFAVALALYQLVAAIAIGPKTLHAA